jgi:Skp family chaperone for outer membrane proteins
MKMLLLVSVALAMAVVVAGCSDAPDRNVAGKDARGKLKTVVVNKGLSKKQEEELNKRLDKLEKKVESQDEKGSRDTSSQSTGSGQPEQSQAPQAEDQAHAAAEAYYQAVAAGNWEYTYDHLDSETQSAYTKQEWLAKNEYLADTGPVTYTIQSVVMDSAYPDTVAALVVVLTSPDGSTSVRNTYFVYEDGSWLHRFSPEEYDLFASVPTGASSASASATTNPSASASASPSPIPSAIPSPGGDIDCAQVNGPIPVPPGDPNNLDGDGDGLGCE